MTRRRVTMGGDRRPAGWRAAGMLARHRTPSAFAAYATAVREELIAKGRYVPDQHRSCITKAIPVRAATFISRSAAGPTAHPVPRPLLARLRAEATLPAPPSGTHSFSSDDIITACCLVHLRLNGSRKARDLSEALKTHGIAITKRELNRLLYRRALPFLAHDSQTGMWSARTSRLQ